MPPPSRAEPGLCKADDQAPFTAAQLIALSRDINSPVMTILDPMIDMVIEKVNALTESNVKNMLAPICKGLNCRIDIIETVLRDECESEEEAGADVGEIGPPAHDELADSSIVQNCMLKRYCFKRHGPKLMHSSDKQSRDEPNLVHSLHDPNLTRPTAYR